MQISYAIYYICNPECDANDANLIPAGDSPLKKIHFAYLSSEDPTNKKVWSGTHYSIYRSLKTLGEVDVLGPYLPPFRTLIARFLNQLTWRLLHKRISYRHSTFISKGYADFFNKKISAKKYDYIIAPAASCELAFLDTGTPVIYITDGTFASCLNYHKSLTHLTSYSVEEGNKIEKKAILKSRYVVVSSPWAANSVRKDYGAPAEKVITIPFGPNFEFTPAEKEWDVHIPIVWNLLFIGVYWESKGGDIAFNAFSDLVNRGFNVSLTVLGCIPPPGVSHPKLTVVPFIDKNDPGGQEELHRIFERHHLLLLPTRFDCTPIVINEASAFGIPSLVADSGGVAGHLKNGVNGFLIDYKDTGKAYAAKIESLINAPHEYLELRKQTLQFQKEVLNWQHWTCQFKKLLNP